MKIYASKLISSHLLGAILTSVINTVLALKNTKLSIYVPASSGSNIVDANIVEN